MAHRIRRLAWLGLALALVAAQPAFGQAELKLSLRKTFGFSAGGQIQGTFRLSASGPSDLARVTFTLDDQELATVDAAPFATSFVTDQYRLGWHTLGAVGQTAAGQALAAAPLRVEFVTPQAVWSFMGNLLLPVGVALLLALLLVGGVPLLLSRRRGPGARPALAPGAPRNYGVLGGAICRACGRPYPRHWWALNLSLAGRLDRCDHCGRWAFARRATPEQLRAAEQAEGRQAAESAPAAAEVSPEERLRRDVEDSRYVE